MAWYDTGTVSVTNGSTAVTGSGTNFVAGAQVGEGFYGPDGRLYEIQAIVSATSLTLADAYLGTTQTGQEYKIVPTQSLVADLASQVSTLISDYQSVADNAGEGKFQDGSATSPGITFTLDQDTGFFRDTANEIGVAVAGVKKAEFNSTGLDVTGTVTADGLTVDGNGSLLTLDNGSNPATLSNTNGNVTLDFDTTNAGRNYIIQGNNVNVFKASNGGDISFYEDTGTTAKFFWDASAESLGIGISSPSNVIETLISDATVYDGSASIGSTSALRIKNDSNTTGSYSVLKLDSKNANGTVGQWNISSISTSTNYDNELAFATRTGSSTYAERIRITNAGNVGIGTSSPSVALDVVGEATVGNGTYGVKLTYSAGNTSGIVDTADSADKLEFRIANSEKMRIDSSGNVGIGVVPNATGGGYKALQLGLMTNWAFPSTGSAYRSHNLYYDGTNRKYVTTGTAHEYEQSSAGHVFSTAASGTAGTTVTLSEAMRIDASGNLLVAQTTSVSPGVTNTISGHSLNAAGYAAHSRSGGVALHLNRSTSDGDIVNFRKDGATVGSIGSKAASGVSKLTIGTGDAGIWFTDNLNSIIPVDVSTNNATDGTLDIGYSSNRFKDLYLSGGVYLGGTGAANKLDDYEEGTWTPTFTNLGTVTLSYARYTKIGNSCTFWLVFSCTSIPTANSSRFTMPFTSNSLSSGTWSRGTVEGGTIEPQGSSPTCYFSQSASSTSGVFMCTATFQTL